MSNEFHLGFVAVFGKKLDKPRIQAVVASWLASYDRIEQLVDAQDATIGLSEPSDILWGSSLQLRIIGSGQFAWAYLDLDGRVIETTGQPNGEQVSLCLEMIAHLDGITEIVPDYNERRLDELEQAGIL